jgi:hypothetical protein
VTFTALGEVEFEAELRRVTAVASLAALSVETVLGDAVFVLGDAVAVLEAA